MNCVCTHALTIVLLLTGASAFARQPDPLTQLEVKGHVYEPQAMAPTAAASDGSVGTFRKAP
jgi:hypothetical protein